VTAKPGHTVELSPVPGNGGGKQWGKSNQALEKEREGKAGGEGKWGGPGILDTKREKTECTGGTSWVSFSGAVKRKERLGGNKKDVNLKTAKSVPTEKKKDGKKKREPRNTS